MNRHDLIVKLAQKYDLSENKINNILSDIFSLIEDEVATGNRVSFTGFGTFERSHRAARDGRNPRTGEALRIPEMNVPRFKAGKTFKDKVK